MPFNFIVSLVIMELCETFFWAIKRSKRHKVFMVVGILAWKGKEKGKKNKRKLQAKGKVEKEGNHRKLKLRVPFSH